MVTSPGVHADGCSPISPLITSARSGDAASVYARALQRPPTDATAPLHPLQCPQGCYEAFRRQLNATHAVSCVPGSRAVTDKAALVGSLVAAYGPAAWGMVPRSFRLPAQYGEMAAYLKQVGGGGGMHGRRQHTATLAKNAVGCRCSLDSMVQGQVPNCLEAPGPGPTRPHQQDTFSNTCLSGISANILSNLSATPFVLQEQAAGRSSLWVLKEDVHRGKGVAVVSPTQLLARALERAPSAGWFGGAWDWHSLLGGGSWAGWQRMLRLHAARQGWRGVLAHVWASWNHAMNELWRSMLSAAGWRPWNLAGSPTRHVLAQQFLGQQYLVGGRPFYIR